MTGSKTTMLFAVPSFWQGMSATLDVGSTLTMYNESETAEEADYKAMYSDWSAVGDDIRFAIRRWEDGE